MEKFIHDTRTLLMFLFLIRFSQTTPYARVSLHSTTQLQLHTIEEIYILLHIPSSSPGLVCRRRGVFVSPLYLSLFIVVHHFIITTVCCARSRVALCSCVRHDDVSESPADYDRHRRRSSLFYNSRRDLTGATVFIIYSFFLYGVVPRRPVRNARNLSR